MRCLTPLRTLLLLVLTALLALWLGGCDRQARAQSGADAVAGIKAARVALEAGYATQEVLNILNGVEAYIPAATGINPAEWPAPRMNVGQILERPAEYAKSAPPVPEPWDAQVWSALLVGGGAAVWAAKRLLPLLPGIGGPVKALLELSAEALWKVTSTADQRSAEKAQALVQSAAAQAAPVLDALRALPPDSLPPEIRRLLDRPIVVQAVCHLAEAGKA